MAKKRFPFHRRILFRLLAPIIVVGIACSTILVTYLSAPMQDFLGRQFDANLRLASIMGLRTCEENFNYMLDLRLEDSLELNQAMQNEALEEIKAISTQFPNIHLMVLKSGQLIKLCSIVDSPANWEGPSIDGHHDATFLFHFGGKAVRSHVQFFPFWDWHVISFVFEQDYKGPIRMAYMATYLSSAGVFLSVLGTLLLVFHLFINKPLNRLVTATESVAEGKLIKIDGITADEFGRLMVSFNDMIDSLEKEKTDRKRSERELRKANSIINRSPFVVFLWKNAENWPVEYVSENVQALFGYAAEDFISGKVFFAETVHPDDLDRVMEEVRQNSDAEDRTEFTHRPYRIVTQNGTVKWIKDLTHIRRDSKGAVSHYEGVVYDITDRKKTEIELQKSEGLLGNVFESMQEGVVVLNHRFEYTHWNRGMEESAKTPRETVLGSIPWQKFPFLKGEIEKAMKNAMQGMGCRNIELKYELPDGKAGWTSESYFPLKDSNDETIGVVGVVEEITSRKQAEEELRHLRNYLSNIIDSMPSVLVGVDVDAKVTQWNRQAQQVTGLSVEKAQSQPLADVFPHLVDEMDRIKRSIQNRQVLRDLKVPREYRDEIRYEDVTIFPLVDNGVNGAVIRVDDVTERVRLEEMMIQSEKMLSVGGLAAGMAHEINNPLAGILQNAAVLHNRLCGDLPANHQAAEAAGTTMQAIGRYLELRKLSDMLANIRTSGSLAATIVKNMLSFARKSESVVSDHDLGELLDQTLNLLKTDYDMKKKYDFKQINIIREYDPTTHPIPCENSKLQQVFMNILKNGAEAMSEAADKSRLPAFTLRVKGDGLHVRVEIEDNGPGIDAKTRRRIFEPFFTTKPVGKGTGLGLSVSYFIITEDHGGEMGVQAAEGGGTCFVIRLPKSGK